LSLRFQFNVEVMFLKPVCESVILEANNLLLIHWTSDVISTRNKTPTSQMSKKICRVSTS